MPAGRSRALLALLILCLIWGYNWVMMKEALRFAAPFDFVALRALASALLLFLAMAARRSPLAPQAPLATLFLGLSTWALYVLNRLPAGTASLSLLMVPVIGLVSSHLQLGEIPGASELAGMLLISAAILILATIARQQG